MAGDAVDARSLIVRGIEAMEGNKSRLDLMERTLDRNTMATNDTCEISKSIGGILERIARAEEDRTRLLQTQGDQRNAWMTRVWSSAPFQLLFLAIVIGLLQVLGLRWVVDNMVHLPPVPLAQSIAPASAP